MGAKAKPRGHTTGIAEQLLARGERPTLGVPLDDWTRANCPNLWELLTLEVYRDRTIRVLPTLTIDRAEGGYRVTLQDHASNRQCSAEADGLGELWEALERAILSPKGWRPFRSRRVQKPERRKKADGGA